LTTAIDLGLYGSWGLLGSRHRLRKHVRGGVVTNQAAAALYRRAKIGLNLYRTSMGFGKGAPRVQGAESLNPRALELAACGVFTVSDYRPEVAEVFGPLVPTFTDPAELGPLLQRWLAADEGRRRLAAQLPSCVAARTFDAMAAQVAADLERVTAAPTQLQEAAG
jgi:glycosyltransferase involved in cell wall biosynthesis